MTGLIKLTPDEYAVPVPMEVAGDKWANPDDIIAIEDVYDHTNQAGYQLLTLVFLRNEPKPLRVFGTTATEIAHRLNIAVGTAAP